MNSVNEVGHILNAMVSKTLIIIQNDPTKEKKLQEIWAETVILCNDWNIDTMRILNA